MKKNYNMRQGLRRFGAGSLLFGAGALIASGVTIHGQETADGEEELFELSPFMVTSEGDTRYRATTTLAGTRLRTELKDVASSISVVTKEFMDDIGATDNQSLLQYTTSTEVGGVGGNFGGFGAGDILDENRSFFISSNNTRVRGLDAADNTRNYFATTIPWDGYNVSRVDIQRGANSVLFGLGKPAGIINTTSNVATMANGYSFTHELDRFGSSRLTADLNQVIIEDELSVRVNYLNKDAEYRQDFAYEKDDRYFVTAGYSPKRLAQNGLRTSFTLSYEDGEVDANRPRTLPPIDMITPWFDEMGRVGIDPFNSRQPSGPSNPNGGQNIPGDPNFQPYLGTIATYGGVMHFFENSASGAQVPLGLQSEIARVRGLDTSGNIDLTIDDLTEHRHGGVERFPGAASRLGLPNVNLGQYKNKLITDPSVFDFYNVMLDGPNKRAKANFDALNLKVEQTFFENKAGIELAYDKQNFNEEFLTVLSDWRQGINIDINQTMVDGSINPNFGRPLTTDEMKTGSDSSSSIETKRATAFFGHDFSEQFSDGWLGKVLGKHSFTALWNETDREALSRGFPVAVMGADYGAAIGVPEITAAARQVYPMLYLGGTLKDRDSASGANIPGISAVTFPTSKTVKYWDATYVADDGFAGAENPDNYAGWTTGTFDVLDARTSDREQMITNYRPSASTVTSKAIVWQGNMLNGALIPMYGYREDAQKSNAGQGARDSVTGLADVSVVASDFETREVEGSLETYGGVVDVNRLLGEKDPLPFNLRLKWGRSENFDPSAARVDLFGNGLSSPNGATLDYGFNISTKDDRYSLVVTKYRTKVQNATNDVMSNAIWGIGFNEHWALSRAIHLMRDDYAPWPGQTQEEATARRNLEVGDFLEGVGRTAPWRTYSQAELDSLAETKAVFDKFHTFWGTPLDDDSLYQEGILYGSPVQPPGIAATSDTVSEGYEFEFNARPVDNLNIVVNVSKTESIRDNVGGALAEFVEMRLDNWNNTAAGDLRYWWAGDQFDTPITSSGWMFMGPYQLMRLGQNGAVPELREWSANTIVNYSFTDGALAGFNVGGSYRWMDEVVIANELVFDPDTGAPALGDRAYGPSEDYFDFWIGYGKRLGDKVDWKIQLNVQNAFSGKNLIPITANPTNPGFENAGYRIGPERNWQIKNTFSF